MNYQDVLNEAAEALKKSDTDLQDIEAVWDFLQPWVEKLEPGSEDVDPGEEFCIDVMQKVVY